MVTYKTIVVPTDGSENAKRALEHALAVADRNHAELIRCKYCVCYFQFRSNTNFRWLRI